MESKVNSDDYGTPPEIVERALLALEVGEFNIDPFASRVNPQLPARDYCHGDDIDGFSVAWEGNLLINPPFTRKVITRVVDKVFTDFKSGAIEGMILITKANTSSSWASKLLDNFPVCFPYKRVHYLRNGYVVKNCSFDSMILYIGYDFKRFSKAFGSYGVIKR